MRVHPTSLDIAVSHSWEIHALITVLVIETMSRPFAVIRGTQKQLSVCNSAFAFKTLHPPISLKTLPGS